MASLADDTFFLSVAGLSRKIKAKEISPVALAEGYLERLERIGPKLIVDVERPGGERVLVWTK